MSAHAHHQVAPVKDVTAIRVVRDALVVMLMELPPRIRLGTPVTNTEKRSRGHY
jgi:hypothetical protein